MNETNLLAALALAAFTYTNSVRVTNWVNTGNFHRQDGTNYVEQWMSEITLTERREVVTPRLIWETNGVVINLSRAPFSRTNTVLRLTPSGAPPLPPTPGVPTKL